MPHVPPQSFAMRAVSAALIGAAGLALASTLAGCGQRDTSISAGLMAPRNQRSPVEHALLSQAATGAGTDRMLYEHHFDGRSVNSLGQDKLQLMLHDPAFLADPHVYVVSDQPEERLAAVRKYLSELGLAEGDVQLHAGLNTEARRSAAAGLGQLEKAEKAIASSGGEGEEEAQAEEGGN